jgi:Fe-S-cluster-containing dehydrogenase component
MRAGLVIDVDRCTGCEACSVACRQWHEQDELRNARRSGRRAVLAADVWPMRVRQFEARRHPQLPDARSQLLNLPMTCMQCSDAACVRACPTGALFARGSDGIVLLDQDACTGCGMCASACPYGACELDTNTGKMHKCAMCVSGAGQKHEPDPTSVADPACAKVCPTGAIVFGDLDDAQSPAALAQQERDARALLAEAGYRPTNRYLMPPVREAASLELPESAGPALRELVRVLLDSDVVL